MDGMASQSAGPQPQESQDTSEPPSTAGPPGGTRPQGEADPRFAAVGDHFAELLASLPGTGAAMAVWCDGRLVLDLWGGWADRERRRPWAADSLAQPYSVTKPFAAVCALRLAETGRLDLDAPVQRYWPEFTAPATVRHILAHQAGVVALDKPEPVEVFYDWDRMCTLLAAQEPYWEPGTAHGESALFYGHLTGELVRRVDGRSPGQFLREEVCGPAGLDFRIGLTPAEQARAVELTGLTEEFQTANVAGKPELYERAVSNPPGVLDASVVNGAAWRAAQVPAVNGHGTARALAGFYQALAAGRLLSPGMLAEAVRVQRTELDLVFGGVTSWGLGFSVDDGAYGMGGLGGSFAAYVPDGAYAVGFVTGSLSAEDRFTPVENTLRDCLGLPPVGA